MASALQVVNNQSSFFLVIFSWTLYILPFQLKSWHCCLLSLLLLSVIRCLLCFHKLTTDLHRFAEELNLRAPIQVNCPIQHIDIQANNSNKQSSALQANSYQSSNSQVAYPTQTEHASLQSKKVTVKRPELLLPGSPESFRQLVRVVIKQLVHPQPDGRGGAQQAPRLLHLPLQDVKDW